MSIDIVIYQKGLFKKTCPLEVILGEALQYGRYEVGLRLEVGERAEGEFIAFHPDHIARGFSVEWTPTERNRIALRALHPTTDAELRDMWLAVERVARHWNRCLIEMDGVQMDLPTFLNSLDDALDFNRFSARQSFIDKALEKDSDGLVLFSAKWPLTFGRREAQQVQEDPDFYARWLHELQSMDVYYAVPRFFESENGIYGRLALTEACPSVFPIKPQVPFGLSDENGHPVKCEYYELCLYSTTRDRVIGTIPYERFLECLDERQTSYYDAGSVLIAPLTLAEMEALLEKAEK